MKLKLLISITLSAILYSSNTASAEDTHTLCGKNMIDVFSCKLLNNKIVSICANKSFKDGHGYIEYMYGNEDSVELNLSTLNNPYALYKNTIGKSHSIVALNGSYKYVVFQSNKIRKSGIKVVRGSSKIASYECSTYQTFKPDMLTYIYVK
jgi:hypothetical protein